MNFKILPKGLEFHQGLTTEMVASRLDGVKIGYDLDWIGHLWTPSRKYFRESNFHVHPEDEEEIIMALRRPDKLNGKAHFYIAKYKVTTDFDWTKISGTLPLDNGELVERVKITPEYYKGLPKNSE
tara:strand:+ start:4313 stop:4690 length:378 start_codon:yes stop_codon:yes gene_type:complete